MYFINNFMCLVCTIFLCTCSAQKAKTAAFQSLNDTTVIGLSRQHLKLNKVNPSVTTIFEIDNKAKQSLSETKKYYIQFDDINLTEAPDGVYEVYLTPPGSGTKNLHPESSYFIGVMDTYALSSSLPLPYRLDVSKVVTHQQLAGKHSLTLQFRGNIFPGNKASIDAGSLNIGQIQLFKVEQL